MRALLLLLVLSQSVSAESTTVYTLTTLPVTGNTPHKLVLLDQGENMLAELGIDLPGNQDDAQDAVFKRMETTEGRNLVKRLGEEFNGVLEAWANGIERLPAIVINEQYLIYGVYDLDAAMAIFRSTKL